MKTLIYTAFACAAAAPLALALKGLQPKRSTSRAAQK